MMSIYTNMIEWMAIVGEYSMEEGNGEKDK